MTIDDADTSASGSRTTRRSNRTPATAKPPRRPGSAPGWLVWSMIVLASVVAIGASMNAWLNRQLLDTDNWVDASDQILEEPAVRAALSTYLVNELFSYVDVSAQLEDRLPDSLQVLAGPISQALREPAIEGVDRLLATPKVQAAWSEANRVAHADARQDPGGRHARRREHHRRQGHAPTRHAGHRTRHTARAARSACSIGSQPDAGTIVIADSEELADAQDAVQCGRDA